MAADLVVASAVQHLRDATKLQTDAANRQSRVMTRLTWTTVVLAIVQAGASVIQVWLAFR